MLDEGDGFLRRALGDEPAVDAAKRVGRIALAAGGIGKLNQPSLSS